jgi:hypothetical protein
MPMRLNVGASRKVTDNNYGSRGASVNLELELDASLVAEPHKLQERIRDLFDLVRTSLAEELHGNSNGHAAPSIAVTPESPPAGAATLRGRVNGNGTGPRPATPSQVRALHAIARGQGIELSQFLYERFQLRRANDLSITQASAAIDGLRAAAGI